MEDTVGHFPASDQVTTETTETTGQYQLRPSCAGGSAGQHAAGQDAWCWALARSLTDHILATSPAACYQFSNCDIDVHIPQRRYLQAQIVTLMGSLAIKDKNSTQGTETMFKPDVHRCQN